MPNVIDYDVVLRRLTEDRWQSLYPRSGAFGLPKDAQTTSLGWIGPPDPSLRPEAQPLARNIGEPVVNRLVTLFIDAWLQLLPGELWIMPKSHWAYELQFGSAMWMPAALSVCGITADRLADCADGSAIAFGTDEREPAAGLVTTLLTNLSSSDFLAAFPGRSAVCTIHSHQQLWWTTADPAVAAALDSWTPNP